jgi:hypothetical protein
MLSKDEQTFVGNQNSVFFAILPIKDQWLNLKDLLNLVSTCKFFRSKLESRQVSNVFNTAFTSRVYKSGLFDHKKATKFFKTGTVLSLTDKEKIPYPLPNIKCLRHVVIFTADNFPIIEPLEVVNIPDSLTEFHFKWSEKPCLAYIQRDLPLVTITKMRFVKCFLNGFGTDFNKTFPNLTYLEIHSKQFYTQIDLKFLPPNLEKLHLKYCAIRGKVTIPDLKILIMQSCFYAETYPKNKFVLPDSLDVFIIQNKAPRRLATTAGLLFYHHFCLGENLKCLSFSKRSTKDDVVLPPNLEALVDFEIRNAKKLFIYDSETKLYCVNRSLFDSGYANVIKYQQDLHIKGKIPQSLRIMVFSRNIQYAEIESLPKLTILMCEWRNFHWILKHVGGYFFLPRLPMLQRLHLDLCTWHECCASTFLTMKLNIQLYMGLSRIYSPNLIYYTATLLNHNCIDLLREYLFIYPKLYSLKHLRFDVAGLTDVNAVFAEKTISCQNLTVNSFIHRIDDDIQNIDYFTKLKTIVTKSTFGQ